MRLVTRADFDGLVCGALVTKFEKIDDYLFVEPKFMQDGLVEIRRGDVRDRPASSEGEDAAPRLRAGIGHAGAGAR